MVIHPNPCCVVAFDFARHDLAATCRKPLVQREATTTVLVIGFLQMWVEKIVSDRCADAGHQIGQAQSMLNEN